MPWWSTLRPRCPADPIDGEGATVVLTGILEDVDRTMPSRFVVVPSR
jgi:hypothetical protein